jgi:hypothetical protein
MEVNDMSRHAQTIKKFWKPDGVKVSKDNEAILKEWMRANGLSMQPGAITALLHSEVHRSTRAAIVGALKRTDGRKPVKGKP